MTETEKPEPGAKLKSFTDMIPLAPVERHKQQLLMLEALMSQAAREKDWPNVLKIFKEAHEMLKRIPSK